MKKFSLSKSLYHRIAPPLDHNQRFIYQRFLTVFMGMAIFCLSLNVFVLSLFSNQLPEAHYRVVLFFIIVGTPITLVIVAFYAGYSVYRRLGEPFADIMSASDAISNGDLSIRLRKNYAHQELSDLANRFNNMVDELERAEQQRRNLTADIAHELRGPLHIIQGNLEGVLDRVYEPTDENINNTLDETRLLARLVNDLQTLSLAENGQLPLHPTPFLVADLLTDTAIGFKSCAATEKITIRVDTSNSPLKITADYDRLTQAIGNLITNALRHTPENGQITLNAEPIPEGARITISDTGTGISPEDLPYIFDRFWRGDKSRPRTEGNSGLGLAITKQLVLAHHGTIIAQSEQGKGTTFIIELPA